jgi:hypothetical protein
LVRDTIARQSDVDKSSMKYEVEPGTGKYRNGTITFAAKKGESIDLKKLRESIQATRLGGNTSSGVNYLEITVIGEVLVSDKETLLKVSGKQEQFLLGDNPKAKPKEGEKTPYQRLTDALAKGKKIATVTGRVEGWSGRWPAVLRELAKETEKDAKESDKTAPKKLALLVVTDFQIAEE